MLIVVAASDGQWNELTESRSEITWLRVDMAETFSNHRNADAFFSLKDSCIPADFESLSKPIFIHSVVKTLADLKAPKNVFRINGWPTFLHCTVWEIAGNTDENISLIFSALGIKMNVVKDEPGFISARIISMIINEACFAIEDNVSSRSEIDTAMKLGTNYPYGPFEWAGLIGQNNIYDLLQKLNEKDSRYKPSAFLIREIKKTD